MLKVLFRGEVGICHRHGMQEDIFRGRIKGIGRIMAVEELPEISHGIQAGCYILEMERVIRFCYGKWISFVARGGICN